MLFLYTPLSAMSASSVSLQKQIYVAKSVPLRYYTDSFISNHYLVTPLFP